MVLEDCTPAAEAVDIRLETSVVNGLSVSVDAALMRRCLENLVLNAIKFSPRQTVVTIDVALEESLRIDVVDEGPGVPEEKRESVFQKFVTVEQRRNAARQTGLGLAFCRMVVEAHGGTITALTRKGNGSIFRILLPSGA